MGPKLKSSQIRPPPKKSEAYRLNQSDYIGNVELECNKKVSQRSGMARKNLKRNVDKTSPISTRYSKRNKNVEDLNTNLMDKPFPATTEIITEPYLKSSDTNHREILGKLKVSSIKITKQSNFENIEANNVIQNISDINDNLDSNTTNQELNVNESENESANPDIALRVFTEDQPSPKVTEPPNDDPVTIIDFGEASCHSVETGDCNVIQDGTTVILSEIAKIHDSLAMIIEMQRKLQNSHEEIKKELQSFKNQNSAYESREKWLSENGINLPMKSMEEFTVYNELIKESSECRKILETSVHFAVNGKKSLTKNIAAVIRKYFTRELASQFTAIKSVKGKVVLAETLFHKYMSRNFLEKSATGILPTGLTESDFNKALGEVLCNAKDWNKSKLMKTIEYESTAALLN